MGWKQVVVDYFSFSRRDRIAILVLSFAVVAVILAPRFISKGRIQSEPITDTGWISVLRSLETRDTSSFQAEYGQREYLYDRSRPGPTRRSKGELFYFDPNTLPEQEWIRLGLRPKTISTIRNFLVKGGRFRQPEDLRRIYGLYPDEYERIAPFVRIVSNSKEPPPESTHGTGNVVTPKNYPARYSVVDINTADTGALIALPGIGSKLANRIITFRDKLGGFYSIDQVGETFGLADSTFQKIKQYLKLENPSIRKININTATVEELKAHPYIRYSLANPIIAYRKEHGLFEKIEDLRKVMAVTAEIFRKIEPYLSI